MKLVKYNSFYLSFYLFYPIPAMLQKYTSLDALTPSYVYLFLFPPLLFNLRHINYRMLIPSLFVSISLAISILIASPTNDTLVYTLYLITIFGFAANYVGSLPLYLGDIERHLSRFAYINLILLAYLPLFRGDIYLDREQINYMSYGYWVSLSFFVFSFLYIRDQKTIHLVFLVASALLIVLFGSRFATISATIGFWLMHSYIKRRYTIYAFLLPVAILFISILIENSETLLISMAEIAEHFHLPATNIYRLSKFLTAESDIWNGREIIARESINIIIENPFGVGIYGYYRQLLGDDVGLFKYPHNIVLQLLMEYGVFVGVFIIVMLVRIIIENFRSTPQAEGWLFFLLLSVALKLVVSGTYLWEPTIWMAITIGLRNIINNRRRLERKGMKNLNHSHRRKRRLLTAGGMLG